MLKKVNEWTKFNMMNFGINKCATMVIRSDTPLFQNKRDPTFYLAGQPIPITKCYTYLGNKINNFYWNRDMKSNSIKAELYDKKQIRRNIKIYKTLL